MSNKGLKYNRDRVTIQQQERFIEIKEYNEYLKEKKKIQDKYSSKPWDIIPLKRGPKTPIIDEPEEGWWEEWLRYKKEITDLILQPDGNFQKFIWELNTGKEKQIVERFLNSAKQGKKRLQDK
jgi:hypothetical protein